MARPGRARHGGAWLGTARQGFNFVLKTFEAGRGVARQGQARHGMARLG
jgi:hypothetical protein